MHNMKSKLTGCLLGLGLLLAAGQQAHALLAVWDSPFTYNGNVRAEWNIFTDDANPGIIDNTPEVLNVGGATHSVRETGGTAFLTSGGNIYSFSAPTSFDYTVGNLGAGTSDVYLRLATLGNSTGTPPQSFTNFSLNGVAGAYQHVFSLVGGGGSAGGDEVEALVSWLGLTHTGNLTLTWNAIGSSVSLDQLSLDVGPVAPVPLPAAAYFMATGLVGLWTMARRKKPSA